MSTARLLTLGLLALSSCILQFDEEPEQETEAEFEEFETDKPLFPGKAGQDGGTRVCGAPGSNSVATDGDLCVCEDGFVWCSGEPSDFSCCSLADSTGA